MRHSNRWLVVVPVIASLPFLACQQPSGAHQTEHPAEVEPISGSELSRVTLSERAIERLDLQTDEVREELMSRSTSPQKVVPYSALIYDPSGTTWVYTSPAPRTFVRHQVEVDYIEGDVAILSEGPPTGTVVASVAVAELYGTEFEVGH